jgi:hypothetical protein
VWGLDDVVWCVVAIVAVVLSVLRASLCQLKSFS